MRTKECKLRSAIEMVRAFNNFNRKHQLSQKYRICCEIDNDSLHLYQADNNDLDDLNIIETLIYTLRLRTFIKIYNVKGKERLALRVTL